MDANLNPILASNESVVSASLSDHSTTIDLNDEMGVGADQLFFVSTYTNFETLGSLLGLQVSHLMWCNFLMNFVILNSSWDNRPRIKEFDLCL